MAHTTEEKKQSPQNPPSHSYVKREDEGKAFEYQKDKPITGEQHGTQSDDNRTRHLPNQQQQKQAQSGDSKR